MTKSGVTNARAPKSKGKGHLVEAKCLTSVEAATLIKAGWHYLDSNDAWCWQEPKTRARYRLADALALVNFCARSRKSGGSR